MTRDEALAAVLRETATAHAARASGNEGMVRVCARRAAGAALAWWLQEHPRPAWGTDAVGRLRGLAGEADRPADVRAAARRLTARVSAGFEAPHREDPLEDCRTVTAHLFGEG